MKVIFLNPPYKNKKYSRDSRSPAITKSGTIYYPIWLSYAAGVLDDTGDFDIKIIDAPASGLSAEETAKSVKGFSPDLLVINTSTPSIDEDLNTAGKIEEDLKSSYIALVGTHVTVLADELLKNNPHIDAVLRGEYDCTIRELAYAIKNGGEDFSKIAGLSFRTGEAIIHNEARPLISDLDKLPFVSGVYGKYLDIKRYFYAAAEYPIIMIMTGRGCPFRCSWCLYPQVMHGRKYRFRSADNVVEELKFIKKRFPHVKEIGFEDDTFTANRDRCRRICELIIGEKLGIRWYANTRADLDFDTMKMMKKAGCRLLIAGFESGNQAILNNIKKGTRVEQSLEFMRNARSLKILVHGCFVLGNPGETEKTMQETLELALKLNPDTAQFFPMMIYPGTEAYNYAKEGNKIKETKFCNWLDDGRHKSIVDDVALKSTDVTNFCSTARKRFYLRPGYIFGKTVQSLLSFNELRRNMKAFRVFSPHLFRI